MMQRKGIHFGTALFLPFLLLILISVAATSWLSLRFGEQAVSDLAMRLEGEITARISEQTDSYLQEADTATAGIVNAAQSGALDPTDLRSQQEFQCRQVQDYPSLKYMAFADVEGQYVGYERKGDQLVYTIIDEDVDTNVRYSGNDYLVDADCQLFEFLENYGPYDATTRGWYSDALEAAKPVWSPTFLSYGPEEFLIISNSAPVVNIQGEFVGVATSSVSLGGISEFLAALEIGDTGEAFIVEQGGGLVATSTDDAVWGEVPDPDNPEETNPTQMTVEDAENSLIQLVLQDLPSMGLSMFDLNQPQSIRTSGPGGDAFVRLTPYTYGEGVEWLIVTVIPEEDFLSGVSRSRQQVVLLSGLAMLAALGLAWLLSRWLVRPISRTITAADAISRGELDVELNERGPAEVGQLARAFNRMSNQLEGSISELELGAFSDALTALPNRAALVRSVEALGSYPPNHAMLFLDADGFKLINDSLGHHVGDQLLMHVANRISSTIPDDAVAARIGGDEFCVLLPNRKHADRIARDLHGHLGEPFEVDGRSLHMSVSVGIAYATDKTMEPADLIRDADIAMYAAKSSSTSGVATFDDSMRRHTMTRLQTETDLHAAVKRREFVLAYQPIVCLQSGSVTGFEALARWNHPTLGIVSPSDFIGVAEDSGLIVTIGEQVLDMACRQLAAWSADPAVAVDHFVAVNVSPIQLKVPGFAEFVANVLKGYKLNPRCLKLEITESALVEGSRIVESQLAELHALGVGLTIDDFGTGYSAMNYLYRFPFTTLKIDRSFVADAAHLPERRLITEAVSALAQSLNMVVIAEGIEEPAQLGFLESIECDQGQGWLFSRALWASEARDFAIKSWAEIAPQVV